MNKIILTKEQIFELVSRNRYRVDENTKWLSRCIDGRYENKVESQKLKVKSYLRALAFPGADVGELALLLATGNTYGFEIDLGKALKALITVIGGKKNFGMHSDDHSDQKKAGSGCGHWKQINLNPFAYKIEKEQITAIQRQLDQLKKSGFNEDILEGKHLEGAVLLISGNWGVLPKYRLQFEGGANEVQVFIFHQTLVDERHRLWAKQMIVEKAVKLYNDCDENYLYQILSETAENHLMETVNRLAKGLPIYEIKFDEDGSFDIKEIGKV